MSVDDFTFINIFYEILVIILYVAFREESFLSQIRQYLELLDTEIQIRPDFRDNLIANCKSQYNNVGLGQNNIVVFPTFLFCPNRFQ